MTSIVISSFHPPVVELPDVDAIPAGDLAIELPAVNVVFGAVDLLPEMKVSGQLPGYAVTFTLTEPMPRETAAAMVAAMMAELERMHQIVQEAFDKRGPLFGRGQLPPPCCCKPTPTVWAGDQVGKVRGTDQNGRATIETKSHSVSADVRHAERRTIPAAGGCRWMVAPCACGGQNNRGPPRAAGVA